MTDEDPQELDARSENEAKHDVDPGDDLVPRVDSSPPTVSDEQALEHLIAFGLQSSSFSGPIAPAEMLRAYRDIDPDILRLILEDFERNSMQAVETERARLRNESRKLDIEWGEHQQRKKGDDSDISYRLWSGRGAFALAVPTLFCLFWAVKEFFYRGGSWSGAMVIGILAVLVCAGLFVVGGKGRVTPGESGMQLGSFAQLTSLVKAVRGETKDQAKQAPSDSGRSLDQMDD